MQRDEQQHQAAKKVTWVGALVNATLGILKLIIGSLFHSAALVADGIHSLSDLITDFMVVLILRISGKGPDEDHPWGHGYFETVGTALLGSLLIAVAGAMTYDSFQILLNSDAFLIPQWPALAVAVLSVLSKEWIFRYTLSVGKAIKSELLIANAWHSRTDALSSVVVFIGVLGAMAGLPWLDSLAAIAVAIFVAKIGWDLTWDSFKQLVNTSLPAEQVAAFKAKVMTIDGVRNVHDFKTRSMGSQKLLELHIQVSPWLSASEGHHIGELACDRLKEDGEISHIIYHIDTYDDHSEEQHSLSLPPRKEIETVIIETLNEALVNPEIHKISLYYNENQISIDILLQSDKKANPNSTELNQHALITKIKQKLSSRSGDNSWIGEIYLATGGSD